MIEVKILADSVNPSESRLTSFLVTYPRYIHSEILTHRAFSRNSASSRAIPFRKMLEAVNQNPALPEYWGSEKKGMQAGEELPPEDRIRMKAASLTMMRRASAEASNMHEGGLHKSIVNRYLEPWMHITVLITASDKGLANFFALRAHPAAEPTFQVLAYRMLENYLAIQPLQFDWGMWHIPRFEGATWDDYEDTAKNIKIATARCARLSYLTHEGEHSPEKDIELHDRLLESRHMSPFEHCAQAKQTCYLMEMSNYDSGGIWSGWLQYRKIIEGENQTNVDLQAILATKPEWI